MTERSEGSATMLFDVLRSVLTEVAEPAQVLRTILAQAAAQTGADRGVFVEVGGSGKLAYRVLYRFQKDQLTGEAGRFSRSVFAEVLRSGKGFRLANAMDDPRFMTKDSIQDLRLTSVLCLPIRAEGTITALVHLESDKPGHFEQHHEALLEGLLEIAGPALGALQASEKMMREREALRQSQEELRQSREFLAQEWSFGRFVGRSPAVRELAETVRRAARTEAPVLLLGETGTGKSILARVLHHASPRAKNAFVTVFCPSLEKGMVETELFGHKRGAFTGAVADRPGKVQAADHGTLLLDEIGELPLEMQAKLLRLLQEKAYERVGDSTERQADARVIAATNRDLEQEVSSGRFRRDLYERLNFVPIRVPPLRERKEDIPLLLRHCLDQHDAGRWIELTADASAFLLELDFSWPGNVRHLEQLAVRATMEDSRKPLTPSDVRRLLDTGAAATPAAAGLARTPELHQGLPALLAQAERAWILEAMRCYPQLSRAELAAKLKIGESTLYKKMRLYGIDS